LHQTPQPGHPRVGPVDAGRNARDDPVRRRIVRFALLTLVVGSVAALVSPLALAESHRGAKPLRADPTRLWAEFPLDPSGLPRPVKPAASAPRRCGPQHPTRSERRTPRGCCSCSSSASRSGSPYCFWRSRPPPLGAPGGAVELRLRPSSGPRACGSRDCSRDRAGRGNLPHRLVSLLRRYPAACLVIGLGSSRSSPKTADYVHRC
jgi:hypothetical protein